MSVVEDIIQSDAKIEIDKVSNDLRSTLEVGQTEIKQVELTPSMSQEREIQKNMLKEKQRIEDLSDEYSKFDIGFSKFNLAVNGFNYIKNKLESRKYGYDHDFVINDGYKEVIKDYEGKLSEEEINDSLRYRGISEHSLTTSLDEKIRRKDVEDVLNSYTTIEQITTSGIGFLSDPIAFLGGVKVGNAVYNYSKMNKLSKFKSFQLGAVAEGSFEAGVEGTHYLIDDYRNWYDPLIAGGFGSVIGGFGVSSVIDDVTKDAVYKNMADYQTKTIDKLYKDDEIIVDEVAEKVFIKGEDGNNFEVMKGYETFGGSARVDDFRKTLNKGKNDDGYTGFVAYMLEDPTGGSRAQRTSVARKAGNKINKETSKYSNQHRLAEQEFKKDYDANKNDYIQFMGDIKTSGDFGELLTNIVRKLERGDAVISDVPKPLSKFIKERQLYNDDIIKRYKEQGIDIEPVQTGFYLRRKWNPQKVFNAVKEFGEDNVELVIKNGIKKEWELRGVEIDAKVAKKIDKISSQIISRFLKQLRDPVRIQSDNLARKQISEELEDLIDQKMLDELGKENIEKIMSKGDIKGPSIAKPKLKMKEDHVTQVVDSKGVTHDLSIENLLENDFTKLQIDSLRKNESDINFRENSKVNVDGVNYDLTNEGDYEKLIESFQRKGIDVSKLERMISYLKQGGINEDKVLNGYGNQMARIFRGFNTITSMAQVFFSQFSELGMMVRHSGIKNTLENIPEVYRLISKMKKGELTPDEKEFFEEAGFALSKDINKLNAGLLNEEDLYLQTSGKNALDKTSNVFSKGRDTVVSKFGLIRRFTTYPRTMAYAGFTKNWYRYAKEGKSLSDDRIMELGLTKKEYIEINKNLKKYSESGNIVQIHQDLKKWNNKELSEKFKDALLKKAENIVMERHLGETLEIMQKTIWGRMAFQFQTYVIDSYRKILMKGLKHRDAETGGLIVGSFAGRYLGLTAKTYANYANDEEKLKEELKMENMAKKTFAYSAPFGTPALILDLAGKASGQDLGFSRRTHKESASDILTSNPTTDKINKVQGMITEDYKRDELKDFRWMVPNVVGVNLLLNETK